MAAPAEPPATPPPPPQQQPRFADASAHGTPCFVTVWNLLPPSRWSALAWAAGVGVLHTNVWLPDTASEWAFGGHDVPGTTGIFALPRDLPQGRPADGLSRLGPRNVPAPGPSPLPDARYVGSWFLGYAAAEAPSQEGEADADGGTGRWAAPQTGRHAFLEPQVGTSTSQRAARQTGKRAKAVAFAMRTILEMKRDEAWHGLSYDLLAHNCNHFSQELVRRLVGAPLPAWMNRAAYLGSVVSSFVPQGLLELQTGMQPADDYDDAESERGSEAAHSADEGTAPASLLHDVARKEGAEQAEAGRKAKAACADE